MKKENLFYLLTMLTILAIRISVLIVPEVNIRIFGFNVHHFWFGTIALIIGILIPRNKIKLIICSVGLGLISDQTVFMILGAGNDAQYWSMYSVYGAVFLAGILFIFRKKISDYIHI